MSKEDVLTPAIIEEDKKKAYHKETDVGSMKQVMEVIVTEEGTRYRIGQEIRQIALTRDEVLFLTQIPTFYLLDELRSRSFKIEGSVLISPTAAPDEIIDIMIDLISTNGLDYRKLYKKVCNRAVERFGSQKEAAKALKMSTRAMCYWMKKK